uniref:Uncharacterized protein n=1 Tax=Rhizophora mucronata TaxID=61149 RepID=A0A2P2KPL8_RHIMU
MIPLSCQDRNTTSSRGMLSLFVDKFPLNKSCQYFSRKSGSHVG